MAANQAVVVSYLTLPPDEQLLFGLKEVFEIFRDKLEQLTFALAAIQDPKDPNPLSPKIENLLVSLRELASAQCSTVIGIIQYMYEFSGIFFRFLDALLVPAASESLPEIMEGPKRAATSAAEIWDDAENGIKKFSEEVVTTFDNIKRVLDKDTRTSTATVFTDANLQAVNDILRAAKDGGTKIRKVSKHLRDTAKSTQYANLAQQKVPTEEIQFVRQKWSEFAQTINVSLGAKAFSPIQVAIEDGPGPEIREARFMKELWDEFSSMAATTSNQADRAPPKAILDANPEPQDTRVSVPSASDKPKLSFLRLLLHRISPRRVFSWFRRKTRHRKRP